MTEINHHRQLLTQKIEELERKLADLKAELQKEVEAEQHEAIDRLDLKVMDLDPSFVSIKKFMRVLRGEVKKVLK